MSLFGSRDNMRKPYFTFQSAGVTFKIRSRSLKSKQHLTPSNQCIYASLVDIQKMVQKIV